MKALDLKTIFRKELDDIYLTDEVDSLFYLCLEHIADVPRFQLALEPELTITKSKTAEFFTTLEALKRQKPIQYIFGETEFYGCKIKVNKHVLIPRQETEELVALILQNVATNHPKPNSPITILDIGTGSGCIAISLAKNIPEAKVYGLDISKDALCVARENAELNAVDVTFIEADILDASTYVKRFSDCKFDIIVSNPPYVRQLEKDEIEPNVLENEPHLALFVEDDNPLLFYKTITALAMQYLKDNGQLYFEINQYLGELTKQVLAASNFKDIELRKDLNGNDRLLKGTKK